MKTTHANLWNTMKAVLKGKFIAISSFFKKLGRHRVNELAIHLKDLEKQQQNTLMINNNNKKIIIMIKIRYETSRDQNNNQ